MRGAAFPTFTTTLAAHVGVTALAQTILAWLDDPAPALPGRLDLAQPELRALAAEACG